MSAEGESSIINISVLFFAKSRELAKTSRAVLAVEPVVIAGNLLKQIVDTYNLSIISNNIILAHNENYIDNLEAKLHLRAGDEIGIIPPISGG